MPSLEQRLNDIERAIVDLQHQVDRINTELNIPYDPLYSKETEMAKDPKKTPEPVGHNMVTYPADLSVILHSSGHIAGHLRGKETLALPDLGQHATTVIGCGLEFARTGPQPVGETASVDYKAMSNEELADALESATAPQAGEGVQAFPWAVLVSIAFDVLRRYLGY